MLVFIGADLCGTHACAPSGWTAPEVWRGIPYGIESDVWSYGKMLSVLYERTLDLYSDITPMETVIDLVAMCMDEDSTFSCGSVRTTCTALTWLFMCKIMFNKCRIPLSGRAAVMR